MLTPKKRKRERRARMPVYWQRIARLEEKRYPRRGAASEEQIKEDSERDVRGAWGVFNTALPTIENALHFKISDAIMQRIGAFTEKKPFKVLDMGCGSGMALMQLKRAFGKKIKTVGLVLGKTRGEKYDGVDRLLVGPISKLRPMEKYDFMYSYMGATCYTRLPITALQKVIEWLKPDGIAVLKIKSQTRKDAQEIRTLLAQNGIKKYELTIRENGANTLVFLKPKARLP